MKEFQPVAEVEEFQPVAEIEESRNEKISAYQKKPSFWDRKITPLLQEVGLSPTTEEIQAQAQNVYSEASDEAEKNVNRILVDESRKLSQEYNIPMRDVFKELSKKKDEVKTDLTVEMMPQIEKNWDDFVYQKYGKLTPRKANERMLGVLSSAGLAVTAAELSPLIPIVLKSQAARETIGKVVTGIGTYMVGNEVGLKRILYPAIDFIEKKIQNRPWYYKRIKNVRELLPEEHTQAAEDIVNLTEIIGLGAISAKFAQKSPAILRKLTKDTFTSYKLPSKLYVTPQDLRNMPEGELRQFMGDIGITGDKEGQAQRVASFLKQGGEVSFPSEKIVTLVDKPYWAKIKGVFRISPFKKVSVSKIPLTTKITPTVFLPEKAGGAVTPSSPMTPDALRLIVEQSGGIWKGIGKGLPAEGEFPATPDLVYFDDPVTKSTMTMPINKVTPEEVKTHLAESRKKFKIKPTTENQEIINQIEIIKDNVSKDLGENATFLLKSLGIYNTDEVAGVLSWDKMKRFNQSTEKNIQEIYNYFARKQNSPLVSDIRFGNDPYNPLKDMSGGIEGGGQLDSKIVNKTLRAYQSINKNIQTQLSTSLKSIKEQVPPQPTPVPVIKRKLAEVKKVSLELAEGSKGIEPALKLYQDSYGIESIDISPTVLRSGNNGFKMTFKMKNGNVIEQTVRRTKEELEALKIKWINSPVGEMGKALGVEPSTKWIDIPGKEEGLRADKTKQDVMKKEYNQEQYIRRQFTETTKKVSELEYRKKQGLPVDENELNTAKDKMNKAVKIYNDFYSKLSPLIETLPQLKEATMVGGFTKTANLRFDYIPGNPPLTEEWMKENLKKIFPDYDLEVELSVSPINPRIHFKIKAYDSAGRYTDLPNDFLQKLGIEKPFSSGYGYEIEKRVEEQIPPQPTPELSSTKDIKETAKAVDMDGNELVDMDGTPMEVNSDGTITLYHRTNLEGATKINKTGNFVSKENTNETFFSNKIEGQAEGYGDEIIAVKVKPSDVRINDAFHGGEIHVAISNKKLSKSSLFKLSSTVAKGGEIKIGANIVYKTESGKEQSGIIDNIFQGTIYAKADGATTSFPITEKQIVKVIPQKYVGEKPKIKRNIEDFTEDEYVKRVGAATGLSKEEVRLAYRQYMAEYNKSKLSSLIETLPQLVEEKVPPQPTPVPVIKRKLAEVKKVSGETAVLIPDKKELLEEIQKAWKAAPTSEEYNPEVHKTVSFKIDGGANILNNQEALSKFFQIVRLAPEKVSVSASMPRGKSVSSLAHQEKIDELINVPKEKGYWTDKKIAVKGEIKGEVGNTVLTNDMDKMIQKEFTSETKPAKLLYYSLESPDVTGVSPTPIPYSKSEGEIIPKAIFKAGDLYYGYDQFRLNVITKRFPAASYGINKDGTLIAYQDKKPIAMLLPFEEYRAVKTPPQFKKAKELGLIEGKANFPKSPSGNAMAGFWGGKKIPVEMGEFVYKLKPMEFPEIVELAKDLMGKYPELKTFTSLAGKFYGVGSAMRIKLHSDLFKRGNEQELAITLAHELGHLVDYLPDYTLKRGNILGRLLSLHKFMKHTFNLMINKEFKTELLRVTQYLHPFDENTVSKRYASYRKSSRELYAEAISLLVNSPGTMEKLAPNFTKAFFDNLDKKLDVKEAYFGLQRLLNGERADLLEHRWRNIQDMFTKGEVRRLEIEAEAKVRRTSSWSIVRQFLDVKTAPLEQRMRQIEKSGKLISPEKNPLYKLEQEDLAQSYIQNQFIQNIDIPILQVLIKNDITLNQFGSYLFLKRVAGKLDIVSNEIQDFIDDEDVDIIQECLLEYTDRKDLANPLGLNSESANELLEFMRNILGDKFNIIEEMGQLFKKFLLSQEEKAALNGRYNLNTFEKIVRPNNDYYVAFGVNDYLQRGVTASIVKQKGTLKGIENPLVTTLLKLVSLMRDNIRQEAKVSALNFFKENMPEEFKTKRQVGYEGEFNIYENGKLVTYYVDKYLAKTFEFSSEGDLALAMVINKWLGNQFFKDLFVTYNAQFSLWFNPIKDFKETYVALKPFLLQKGHNLTVQELLIAWFKSIPSSHLRQKGIYDNVIQDMMNNFALNTPVIEFDLNAKDETHKFIMDKFNINTMTMEGHKKLLRFLLTPVIKLMRGIKFAGSIFEVNSKITSWKLLKKYGFGDIEAAHITKRYPGTPDYREKGLLGNTSNAIVFYYNVRKSGIKRAIELGTNPKTRAGYWWAVFEMDIIPTILKIMAELGILGVVLKKFYDKYSEYTKTNYDTVLLGFSVNGKPIGIQIPHGFAGGLASAILRKMVMSLKGKSKQLEQIFALPYQELPGLAPIIDIAIKNFQYMSGQNPRDDFYGQNILTDREQKARGWIGLKRMIKWTISKTGLIRMNNYNTEDSTVMESIMRINPLTNRILKIAEKTDIDVEAEKMKEEMIVREQKELRILIPIKEDFIKSGLTPIEYTKTPAFQKVKNNLRNIYGDDWTPEREMSLTTRIQNIFNDPRTQELWAMQNYRKSQTIEQKKYWLGRAMQAKKDVIKKKLGSFPKSVR